MHPLAIDRDYRKIIIPSWVARRIETFPQPSLEDLKAQSRYSSGIIEAFIPGSRSSAILEIGCGFGRFLYALNERGYTNLKAIDIIPECCAFVEQQLKIRPECVDVVDFLTRDEGTYDAIVALDVIEHFNKNEIVAIVQRLYDNLNPGGVFVMRVPNGSSVGGVNTRYSGFTHETAFTKASVNELFRAVGFSDVRCLPDLMFAQNSLKRALKVALVHTVGSLVSLSTLFSVESSFAISNNVTGVGWKRAPPECPDSPQRGEPDQPA